VFCDPGPGVEVVDVVVSTPLVDDGDDEDEEVKDSALNIDNWSARRTIWPTGSSKPSPAAQHCVAFGP
jgi:hypothetical protein